MTTAVASSSSSVAGSISFHDTRMIWSARMRTKLQRIQVKTRNTKSAFSRNQTGPSQTGPGPAQAPRNSSAPRNDAPRTCAYSASWMIANFIPEYSTRKPATSSDSASRMSKGARFSAATPAMMNARNASWPITG